MAGFPPIGQTIMPMDDGQLTPRTQFPWDGFNFDIKEATGGKDIASRAITEAYSTIGKGVDGIAAVRAAEAETKTKQGFESIDDFSEAEGIEAAVSKLRVLFPSFDEHVAKIRQFMPGEAPTMRGVTPNQGELEFSRMFSQIAPIFGVSPLTASEASIAPYRNAYAEQMAAYNNKLKILELVAPELTKAFTANTQAISGIVDPFAREYAKKFAPKPTSKLPKGVQKLQDILFDPDVSDDRMLPAINGLESYLNGTGNGDGAIANAIAKGDMEMLTELQSIQAAINTAKSRKGPSTEQRGMEANIKAKLAQAFAANAAGGYSNARAQLAAKDSETKRISANAAMKRALDAIEIAQINAKGRVEAAGIAAGGRIAGSTISANASQANTKARIDAAKQIGTAKSGLKEYFDVVTKQIETIEEAKSALKGKDGRVLPGKKAEFDALNKEAANARQKQQEIISKMGALSEAEDKIDSIEDVPVDDGQGNSEAP